MRPPPAVALSCEDDGRWRLFESGLPGLTSLVLARWGLAQCEVAPSWGWGVSIVAGAAVAVVVWCRWRRLPQRLSWDGARWSLQGAGAAPPAEVAHLQVAIDLGGWMLLRCVPVGARAPRWLAVGAGPAAAARPALYAASAGVGAAPVAGLPG
jgi:hypothetical protein